MPQLQLIYQLGPCTLRARLFAKGVMFAQVQAITGCPIARDTADRASDSVLGDSMHGVSGWRDKADPTGGS